MVVHRLRRWTNIKPALFSGPGHIMLSSSLSGNDSVIKSSNEKPFIFREQETHYVRFGHIDVLTKRYLTGYFRLPPLLKTLCVIYRMCPQFTRFNRFNILQVNKAQQIVEKCEIDALNISLSLLYVLKQKLYL